MKNVKRKYIVKDYWQRKVPSFLPDPTSPCETHLHFPHEVEVYLVLGKLVSSSESGGQVRWNRKGTIRSKIKNLEIYSNSNVTERPQGLRMQMTPEMKELEEKA